MSESLRDWCVFAAKSTSFNSLARLQVQGLVWTSDFIDTKSSEALKTEENDIMKKALKNIEDVENAMDACFLIASTDKKYLEPDSDFISRLKDIAYRGMQKENEILRKEIAKKSLP